MNAIGNEKKEFKKYKQKRRKYIEKSSSNLNVQDNTCYDKSCYVVLVRKSKQKYSLKLKVVKLNNYTRDNVRTLNLSATEEQ